MKKVVVLGANGYLGWHFTQYLLSLKAYEVFAYVQKGSSVQPFGNSENLYIKEFLIEEIMNEENPLIYEASGIINFSWMGVSTKLKNNLVMQVSNLYYLPHVLEFVQKHKIKKYISLGSASECVYGKGPINSRSNPYPCDTYSACKVSAKFISEVFCKQHNIMFNWIRLSSVYGPKRYDGNIIDYTISKILSKEDTEYTPLEQLWDYIYIDDVVRGIEAIFKNGYSGTTYPLGFGKSMPLYTYIDKIRVLMNYQKEMGIGKMNYKLGKPDNCVIEMEETTRDTGFICTMPFEKGIQIVIDDYRKRGK